MKKIHLCIIGYCLYLFTSPRFYFEGQIPKPEICLARITCTHTCCMTPRRHHTFISNERTVACCDVYYRLYIYKIMQMRSLCNVAVFPVYKHLAEPRSGERIPSGRTGKAVLSTVHLCLQTSKNNLFPTLYVYFKCYVLLRAHFLYLSFFK